MQQKIYHLHALSALHVGIGEGTGIIDLPIAREKAGNLPFVPGSSVKGVLRDEMFGNLKSKSSDTKDDLLALFGPEPGENASEYAGALAVGDARLLCLPIRSWCGTFAWATCPMILNRYKRDLYSDQQEVPIPAENQALLCDDSQLTDGDKIYLEDLDLQGSPDTRADKWAESIAAAVFNGDEAWTTLFKQRFAILPDNVFDFLAETATEIRARIRIEEGTRTVQSGALWYEEYLPAETLLWGNIAADRSRKETRPKNKQEMLALLPNDTRLQIGGNASVGGGQVRWILPNT